MDLFFVDFLEIDPFLLVDFISSRAGIVSRVWYCEDVVIGVVLVLIVIEWK